MLKWQKLHQLGALNNFMREGHLIKLFIFSGLFKARRNFRFIYFILFGSVCYGS